MFKNTLFLKIILIFTLPALGILYFSSVLVYEKVQSFDEVDGINNNLIYLKKSEKLIDSLQNERELTVIHFLQKNQKSELQKARNLSNNSYEDLEKTLVDINLDNRFSQLKFQIKKLEIFRTKVDKSDVTLDQIFEEYNELNRVTLDSLNIVKPIKLAFDFNNEIRNNI